MEKLVLCQAGFFILDFLDLFDPNLTPSPLAERDGVGLVRERIN